MSDATAALILPFPVDGDGEPVVTRNREQAVIALILEVDQARADRISQYFREGGSGDLLALYGYDFGFANHIKLTVPTDDLWNQMRQWSGMHVVFADENCKNFFYRHQENERVIFFGNNDFVMRCASLIDGTIEQEFEQVAADYGYSEDERAAAERFLSKYRT